MKIRKTKLVKMGKTLALPIPAAYEVDASDFLVHLNEHGDLVFTPVDGRGMEKLRLLQRIYPESATALPNRG